MGNDDEIFKTLNKQLTIVVQKLVDSQVTKALDSYREFHRQYYHIKEVSEITGLTVGALKGRIRRKTLKAAYDSTSILIPTKELDRLLVNLKQSQK